jgi:hypothetical protein
MRSVVMVALLGASFAVAQDTGKPAKIEFVHYKGYFEKNNSGLKGESSYLVISTAADFDKYFGFGRVMGPKPVTLPTNADDFKKLLVIAAIKRGNVITEYTVESVTASGETLTINYKAVAKGVPGNASFASPMVVSIPAGKYTKVEFNENGKVVEKVNWK